VLTSFLVMALMGLVGSLHCIGMCGGLVSALSMGQPRIWWTGLAGYQAGRITTYAALGLAVGLLGGGLGGLGSAVPRLLAVLAGGVMVIFGLNMAGWAPDPLRRLSGVVRQRVGLVRLTAATTHHPTLPGWYTMGLANGLLPCGLVYAALSLSLAAGDLAGSTVMMVGFGLGTVPAMMLAPAAVRALTPSLRGTGLRVLGAIVVVLGVLTMARGGII